MLEWTFVVNITVATFLIQDGLTTGLLYGLLATSILLVFMTTRILWVPSGEMAVFSALTLAMLQQGHVPGTVYLLLVAGVALAICETWRLTLTRQWGVWRKQMALGLVYPIAIAALTMWIAPLRPSLPLQVALTLLLIVPMGPILYRLVFRPIAKASILSLLFVAIAVHYALAGLGLVFFGPEGFRTPPFIGGHVMIGSIALSWHLVLVGGAAFLIFLLLYILFSKTRLGKALRGAAVNSTGARLVGIPTDTVGSVTFTLATFISALVGVLIGPITTLYYDSGFAFSLKSFIAVVFAGMVSFPITALGALAVGIVETFAAFYASAYRDVIVFGMLIPILVWLSAKHSHSSHSSDDE